MARRFCVPRTPRVDIVAQVPALPADIHDVVGLRRIAELLTSATSPD